MSDSASDGPDALFKPASGKRKRRVAGTAHATPLQALVDEGRLLLNASADPSAYELDTTMSQLRSRFADLQSAAAGFADVAGAQGQRIYDAADSHVRQRPWAATLEALAIGFVVGWLVAERS
jgi:ElaB/YqjD/DUF883 family membrane-anchored ribosome-binding protein